jgi:hypothetical protein
MDRNELRKRYALDFGTRPAADRHQPAKKPDHLLNHLALASVMLLLEIELRAFVRACNAA